MPLDLRLIHALNLASDAAITAPGPLTQDIRRLLTSPGRVTAPSFRPWGVALAAMLALSVGGLATWALYQQHAGRDQLSAAPPLPATPSASAPPVAPEVVALAASTPAANELPPDEAGGPEGAASAPAIPPAVASAASAAPDTSAPSAASTPRSPAPAVMAPPPALPALAASSPPAAPAPAAAAASLPARTASAAGGPAEARAEAPAPAAPIASAGAPRSGTGAAEWSQALQLPTLKDIPWRLGLGFETISRIRLDGRSRNATAQNCRELLAALDAGLLMALDQDVPAANFEAVACRAIALVGRAGRATRSSLEGFKLDAASVPRLPAETATAVDAATAARLAAASARQQSLAALFPDLRSRVQGDTLVLGAGDWESRLHVMARGDFDLDGQDDLLLSVIERTVDNRYENTKLFIVTRDAPDQPLRVLRQVH